MSGYIVNPPRQTLGGQTTRTQTVTASGDLVTVQRQTREQTIAVQTPAAQAGTGRRETAAEKTARRLAMVQEGVSLANFKGNQFASGGSTNIRVEGDVKAVAEVESNTFDAQKNLNMKIRGPAVGAFFGEDGTEDANKFKVGGNIDIDAVATGNLAAAAALQQQILQQPALQQALANAGLDQTVLLGTQRTITATPQTVTTTDQAFTTQITSAQVPAPAAEPRRKKGRWGLGWLGRN